MIYVTTKLPKMYHQMSFEEFLFSDDERSDFGVRNEDLTSTRTYKIAADELSPKLRNKVNVDYLVEKLWNFNNNHSDLFRVANRKDLYREFKIPKKKSGGLRTIDAPNAELMNALRELKYILEDDFGAMYHTNAFAYIKGRNTLSAVKKHQFHESNWFAKYDLSNFFGSTTPDFVIHMLKMIYPFNLVLANNEYEMIFRQAIDLAFLDGGLPQGTPISPLITNLMMIPIDYELTTHLRNYNRQTFIYTRYADDFIISSRINFDSKNIERLIEQILSEFGAPFALNSKKTRYGSRAGRNWNLGVMLGQDNKITIGCKKKRQFQTMLFNFGMDYKNGIIWPKEDVQHMEGLRSYYKMVEGETIDRIVSFVSSKVGSDIMAIIKFELGR